MMAHNTHTVYVYIVDRHVKHASGFWESEIVYAHSSVRLFVRWLDCTNMYSFNYITEHVQ